jgi:hypothetical protein
VIKLWQFTWNSPCVWTSAIMKQPANQSVLVEVIQKLVLCKHCPHLLQVIKRWTDDKFSRRTFARMYCSWQYYCICHGLPSLQLQVRRNECSKVLVRSGGLTKYICVCVCDCVCACACVRACDISPVAMQQISNSVEILTNCQTVCLTPREVVML